MDMLLQFGGLYWPYIMGLFILAFVLLNGWSWWKEKRS
jgi:cellulose synthase/poly-beta-1,6-N-acetylglucosamine synthase-like glycosyltransferase